MSKASIAGGVVGVVAEELKRIEASGRKEAIRDCPALRIDAFPGRLGAMDVRPLDTEENCRIVWSAFHARGYLDFLRSEPVYIGGLVVSRKRLVVIE